MTAPLPFAPLSHIGGLSIAQFLARFWQKKPLVARNALPVDALSLTARDLFKLGCAEDAEARIIRQVLGRKRRWLLDHGPFEASDRADLDAQAHDTPWTLLVQDVNHFRDDAAQLLQRFAFVPQARLDDLMVSLASDGGGVGPHVDSYDVFLIQLRGQRRWRIAEGGSRETLPNAPIKLLKHFDPDAEWLLEPGDMLYLPAGVAHDGIAVGECMTASVGFRVPTPDEVRLAMLQFWAEVPVPAKVYRDQPARWPATDSAAVPAELAATLAQQVRSFVRAAPPVDDCVGRILTLPKPGVVFDAPKRALAIADFVQQAQFSGLQLHRKTRMLRHAGRYYLNGIFLATSSDEGMANLAHTRAITRASKTVAERLYAAYLAGEVVLLKAG